MIIRKFVQLVSGLPATSTLCALVLGCDGGSGSSEPADRANNPASKPASAADVCDASCTAQTRLGCRTDLGYSACYDACIDFSTCSEEFQDLNWCMANAPLFCDAQGYAAVKAEDCGPEIDRFGKCLE
ncbi:MAG: hypothetical protein K0S65_270 [Labilithrix sp.]|nr:hypothetical protein [Labilithrix sp.]